MKFTRVILPNGLTVLHEYRSVPVSTVAIASRLGAAYETESEKGISHFLEHMCFKGTKRRSVEQISSEIENIGGDLNAFTDECVTCYHATVPSTHTSVALDVLTDMYFRPTLKCEDMKKEAEVICEEIKRYIDAPGAYSGDRLKENLYRAPLGLNIAGSEKIVRGMTREQLQRKHDLHYCPENSLLCIVGNSPLESVLEFFGRNDFSLGSGQHSSKITVEKINIRDAEQRAGIKQATLTLGIHFPSASSPQTYAAELFSTILGDGMSSRLFSEIREKRGFAYDVRSDYTPEKDFGALTIFAGVKKKNISKVTDLIIDEVRKMAFLTDEELSKAKERLKGCFLVGSEGCMASADSLIRSEIEGSAESHYAFQDRINGVTLDEVRALADVKDYSSFVLGPK
jgi:predicted Zn-dependent peptidase